MWAGPDVDVIRLQPGTGKQKDKRKKNAFRQECRTLFAGYYCIKQNNNNNNKNSYHLLDSFFVLYTITLIIWVLETDPHNSTAHKALLSHITHTVCGGDPKGTCWAKSSGVGPDFIASMLNSKASFLPGACQKVKIFLILIWIFFGGRLWSTCIVIAFSCLLCLERHI